jgi:hypothetical protein
MKNQTISTVAFVVGAGALAAFVFKFLPANQAIMIGGAGALLGYVTKPDTVSA